MKHFEPIWGDTKPSYLSASAPSTSKYSYPKQNKTETITAPVTTPPVSTTKKTSAATTCSSSNNNNKTVKSNSKNTKTEVKAETKVVEAKVVKTKVAKTKVVETKDIQIEDIPLQLPWDSINSAIDSTSSPIIKDVILPAVSIFSIIFNLKANNLPVAVAYVIIIK